MLIDVIYTGISYIKSSFHLPKSDCIQKMFSNLKQYMVERDRVCYWLLLFPLDMVLRIHSIDSSFFYSVSAFWYDQKYFLIQKWKNNAFFFFLQHPFVFV